MIAVELDEKARLRKVVRDALRECRRWGATEKQIRRCTTIFELHELRDRLVREAMAAPRTAA